MNEEKHDEVALREYGGKGVYMNKTTAKQYDKLSKPSPVMDYQVKIETLEITLGEQDAEIIILKRRIDDLEACLRYGRNEMKYRLFQIEGGYDIPMVGEMYKFIKMAENLLTDLPPTITQSEPGALE